jgi:UDP-glucose 4-epimerase
MNILITGGAGYIGSHTCTALLNVGYNVIIADDLRNSSESVIECIKRITGKNIIFYKIDVTVRSEVENIFLNNHIDGVIHFAGLKSVGESVAKPLVYYYNNILSTIILAEACLKYHAGKFVFSSSATVYGENKAPFIETMDLLPAANPYGETKAICERILTDTSKTNKRFAVSILRYFNPVGAHQSGLIGETPKGIPNNLMPYIIQVAKGKMEKLHIFGNDYPTPDGTGIRDYIHVMDLAEGHIAALEHLKNGFEIYNLGTGHGTSVMQLIKAFEDTNNIKIPYDIIDRRPGDLAMCYADTSKAERELYWKAERNICEMCRDAWKYGSK